MVFLKWVVVVLMADSEGFDEDQLGGGGGGGVGCFLPLLFSDEVVGLDLDETLNYTSSFSTAQETPKMLCFGTYSDDGIVSETVRTVQMPGEVTCSDSSSTCNNKPNSSSKPNVSLKLLFGLDILSQKS